MTFNQKDDRREVLSDVEIEHLVALLKQEKHRACAAAVALMLWGGVHYNKLRHLQWGDLWDTKKLPLLPPNIHGWLMKWAYPGIDSAPILPRGWKTRWPQLKRAVAIPGFDARMLHATYLSQKK